MDLGVCPEGRHTLRRSAATLSEDLKIDVTLIGHPGSEFWVCLLDSLPRPHFIGFTSLTFGQPHLLFISSEEPEENVRTKDRTGSLCSEGLWTDGSPAATPGSGTTRAERANMLPAGPSKNSPNVSWFQQEFYEIDFAKTKHIKI